MKLQYLYTLLLICFGLQLSTSSNCSAQTIQKAVLSSNVKSLNPVDNLTAFKVGSRVYCWVKITNGKPGENILIDWYMNDKFQHQSTLKVKYSSMRTYTYKTVRAAGNWRANIRTKSGKLLKSMDFTVGSSNIANSSEAQPSATVPAMTTKTSNGKAKPATQPVKKSNPPKTLSVPAGYSAEVKEESIFLLPPEFKEGEKYPVLVVLPFTGGTSAMLFANYYNAFLNESVLGFSTFKNGNKLSDQFYQKIFEGQSNSKPFIVMLTQGMGSEQDHNWQGFTAAIYRYEDRILQDLEKYKSKYPIDMDNIMLSGFSLGGDLSWAISHRHPDRFKGGIISGSRCSYQESGRMDYVGKEKVKYYIVMGENESKSRLTVLEYAMTTMKTNDVNYIYKRTEGEHVSATFEQLAEGINYLLKK